MNALLASARLQLLLIRSDFTVLLLYITAPLTTIALVAAFRDHGRPELELFAVVGPGIMSIIQICLFVSAETVSEDRDRGVLEVLVASPASMFAILSGRVVVTTLISLGTLAESLLVAWVIFQTTIPSLRPLPLILGLAITAVGIATTGLLAAALLVLTRSARIFQNSLAYPLFLLGGVLVPATLLPFWLRPVSDVVFITWTVPLIRYGLGLSIDTPPAESAVIGGSLVLATAGLATYFLYRVTSRIRQTGSIIL